MNFVHFGKFSVLDPASGNLVDLDLDSLGEELRGAFRRCSIHEEWIGDSVLEVLRERLLLDQESGVGMTASDVRRRLVGVLDASGFPDVAREFIVAGPSSEESSAGEFSGALRSWDGDSLAGFLARQGEFPPEVIPGILERLPGMLSGAGVPLASESLVLEFARHLSHFLGEGGAPHAVSLTSRTRYIPSDAWELPVDAYGQGLLGRRVVVPQSVSDILPVAVVQCHLVRLFDFPDAPAGEAGLREVLPRLASFLRECLELMCGRMTREWPEVAVGNRVVRFMEFGGLLQILSVSHQRRARREMGLRLEEAIRACLGDGSFPVLVRFS